MPTRLLNFILILVIISIPFAHAQDFQNSQHEITKVVHIYRGEGSIPLNLSDPKSLAAYAPTTRFWDENITGPGKILDGVLPPDFLFLNTTSISLSWNFTLSSDIIADGTSQFILRLPVSFLNDTNHSEPEINITLMRAQKKVLIFDNGGNQSDIVSSHIIKYVNLTLNLWYVNLTGFLFPAEQYQLKLTLSHISNPILLIYNYDYLDDNITVFYLDNENYSADLAVGFEFKQLTSNGISAVYVNSNCTQIIKLDSKYSGSFYVSFAWDIYSPLAQNITLTLTSASQNSMTISLQQGLNTVRGNLLVNLSGDTLKAEFSATSPFYLIVDGISSDAMHLRFITIYTKLYGDIVINSDSYYTPGAVVLPGSWQKSIELAIKYAPPALLPVILVQAEYHTLIYTYLKIYAEFSNLLYQGMDFLAGIICGLFHGLFMLFNWTYTTIVHWLMSDASWWFWAILEGVWFLLQVGVYVLAVWITDSFLRGIVALPDKGIKGMVQEWSEVTSFVENIISSLRRRLP